MFNFKAESNSSQTQISLTVEKNKVKVTLCLSNYEALELAEELRAKLEEHKYYESLKQLNEALDETEK